MSTGGGNWPDISDGTSGAGESCQPLVASALAAPCGGRAARPLRGHQSSRRCPQARGGELPLRASAKRCLRSELATQTRAVYTSAETRPASPTTLPPRPRGAHRRTRSSGAASAPLREPTRAAPRRARRCVLARRSEVRPSAGAGGVGRAPARASARAVAAGAEAAAAAVARGGPPAPSECPKRGTTPRRTRRGPRISESGAFFAIPCPPICSFRASRPLRTGEARQAARDRGGALPRRFGGDPEPGSRAILLVAAAAVESARGRRLAPATREGPPSTRHTSRNGRRAAGSRPRSLPRRSGAPRPLRPARSTPSVRRMDTRARQKS